jgi:hypothetical protein
VLLQSYVNQKEQLIVHVDLHQYQVILNKNMYQHEQQIQQVMLSWKEEYHSHELIHLYSIQLLMMLIVLLNIKMILKGKKRT